jgi:lipoyl(octanoyl) transferase
MNTANKDVKVIDLGLIDYKECWDYQEKLFNSIIELKIENRKSNQNIPTTNYLILCEHPPVYTLGKSGDLSNLLLNDDELETKGIDFYKINRGGDITFHGPGQLVMYPIFDLDNFFTDIHRYLRFLEEAVIKVCAHFQLQTGRYDGFTGVWLDTDNENARKICAMGVKCSRWVTMHGIAFNIKTDLNYFKYIIPCGIEDKDVTSLQKELGEQCPTMPEVKEQLLLAMKDVFEISEMQLSGID